MNRDTLLRQWAMLHLIPRWPQRRSTTEIAKLLADRDHTIHVRTIQRDLSRLSTIFNYSSESEGRTEFWFFPKDQKLVDLPAMGGPAAMALLLSKEYLDPLLPPATMKVLAPYFGRAEEVLRETPGALSAWRDRICVITRGPRLQSAKIAENVQATVYEAVLTGRQLSVTYRSRGGKEDKEQTIHPLGLVVYDGVTYVIATAWDFDDPVSYSLHRVRAATLLADAAKRHKSFDLATYAKKTFRFPISEETFRLVARFDAAVAKHLAERPLAADQEILTDDGVAEVSATVADTEDLRWWLLGFGDFVEVVKPAKLRADMKRRLQTAAGRYG